MNFNISFSGWQGNNFLRTKNGQELKSQWLSGDLGPQLHNFHSIPYEGYVDFGCTYLSKFSFILSLKTRIHDKDNRKWLVRTFVGKRELELLDSFEEQVKQFVLEVEAGNNGFTEKQMESNSRGPHFVSIIGHDRNNKKVW